MRAILILILVFSFQGSWLPVVAWASNPAIEELDCPLLPGCPGETRETFPLPPVIKLDGQSPKDPARPKERRVLKQGAGRFSDMALVPAGEFEMGSSETEGRPDERPKKKIFLKEFYISSREVTVDEYCDFLNSDGNESREGGPRVALNNPECPLAISGKEFQPKGGMADRPMICVSWFGAAEYAEWAGGRLPTSVEWEKAALLVTPNPPEDSLSLDWAGSRKASSAEGHSSLGMVGNVWQWCSDWYDKDYYASCPSANPPGAPLGNEKNLRGGSYAAAECSIRIRNRHKAAPRGCYRTVGFRIVKDAN
jgi:sulfatase modifying factor 1